MSRSILRLRLSFFVLAAIFLCGCGDGEKKNELATRIVGKWAKVSDPDDGWEFTSGGHVILIRNGKPTNEIGTYRIIDQSSVELDYGPMNILFKVELRSDDEMILTGDSFRGPASMHVRRVKSDAFGAKQSKDNESLPTFGNERDRRILGKWQRTIKGSLGQASLQFTQGGTIILKYRNEEEVGRFHAGKGELSIRQKGESGTVRYSFEITSSDELVLGKSEGSLWDFDETEMTGRWLRAEGPSALLSKYAHTLKEQQAQKAKIQKLLTQRQKDRASLLTRLSTRQGKDATWRSLARELSIVTAQIDLLEKRHITLGQTITRLESVVRSDVRKEEIKDLGLDEKELEKLSELKHTLDEELRSAARVGPVENLQLEALVEKELQKQKEKSK